MWAFSEGLENVFSKLNTATVPIENGLTIGVR